MLFISETVEGCPLSILDEVVEEAALGMTASGPVNFSCSGWLRKRNFSWSNQNYWAIFLVPLVDFGGSLQSHIEVH